VAPGAAAVTTRSADREQKSADRSLIVNLTGMPGELGDLRLERLRRSDAVRP